MHDYKNHRPVRYVPVWIKVTLGLAVLLPFLWVYVVILLSF
jgi:hypothetical protein